MARPWARPVFALFGVLVVLATLLWVIVSPTPLGSASPTVVSVGVLLIAFAVIEWWPLTLEHRGETFHLTLSGVAVLVGLFFVGPLPTLGARLVGSGAALRGRWANPWPKLLVNLAGMALEVWVSGVMVSLIGDVESVREPAGWILLLLASMSGEGAMTLCTLAGMRLSVGPIRAEAVGMVATGTLATTSLVTIFTIVTVVAVDLDPRLLVVVAAAMALPVTSNRQRHDLLLRFHALRGLYRFMTQVEAAEDTTEMLSNILDEASAVVGSASATLFLIDEGRTTRMSNAGGTLGVGWVPRAGVDALIDHARDGRLLRPGQSDARYADLLDSPDTTVVASLGHVDVEGVLVLSGRPGNLPEFDQRDVELASAVARHAGSALAEARLVDRLREERYRVEQMSKTDTRTGLRNREGLCRDVPELLAGAVIVLSLRDLEQVRTGLGHEVADRMLTTAAIQLRRIAEQLHMVVAAIGDRFALVAPEVHGVLDSTSVVRQVEWELSGQFEEGPLTLDIAPVMGVAVAPTHGSDTAELIRAAEKAMAQASESRMAVAWFDADYDRRGLERLQLAADLRRALDAGQLDVAYQPQVDMASGRVVGVEALARWQHPRRGPVPPAEFVDVAERTGLVAPLTRFVSEVALTQLDQWRRLGLDLSMAINLSLSVAQDTTVATHLVSLVRAHQVPPEKVIAEITESQVMADVERGSSVVNILRAAGIRLSVDDFGTGYSSLAQIKHLPVHELKIDRSFLTDLPGNSTDLAIVSSVLRLADELDLIVVAEGIEDEETRQLLLELRCDVAQGYLFERPLPAARIPAAIKRIEARYAAGLQRPIKLHRRSGSV